ncbi:MAG: helix-turn-helix transcriptional regulator [Bacteroidota bacterium]|jgi:predicted DNA-binding transcriptional regulator YafY
MPLNKNAFYRYLIIDSCINNRQNPYPSLEDLKEAMKETLGEVAERTIKADLKEMRDGQALQFYAPIKFSKERNGYYYEEDNFTIGKFIKLGINELDSLEFVGNILSVYRDTDLFKHFEGAIEKIKNDFKFVISDKSNNQTIIFPDTPSKVEGLQNIPILINFIRNAKAIDLTYAKFNSESKVHVISPLFLKEFDKRWYLISYCHHKKDIITFGLDRIKSIAESREKYNFFPPKEKLEMFNHIVGITTPPVDNEIKKIKLQINKDYIGYLKNKKNHHSQLISELPDGNFLVEYDLVINQELYNWIVGLGVNCKVLEPKELVKKVKSIFIQSLNQYQ